MSDWQIGDLALCVDTSNLFGCGVRSDLEVGRVYEVLGLEIDHIFDEPCLIIVPADRSASVRRFRKIRPDEHEGCEPEFVELLNRSKPKVPAPLSEEGLTTTKRLVKPTVPTRGVKR